MKNIHIHPTTQPSRLWINNLLQGKLELSKETLIGSNTAKHIYITSDNGDSVSDEGVHHNYGSLVLDINNEKVFKTCVDIISGDDIQKIILTTDPTLIADGVQAIDDEFLEWFVKNSSCEFVEVKIYPLTYQDGITFDKMEYQIIIPQEEPKQETLEDAAERNCESITHPYCDREKSMFIAGAKWQAERMYSEEDMREAFKANYTPFSATNIGDVEQDFQKWFEQFKKK
jgi:hypothetical protein